MKYLSAVQNTSLRSVSAAFLPPDQVYALQMKAYIADPATVVTFQTSDETGAKRIATKWVAVKKRSR